MTINVKLPSGDLILDIKRTDFSLDELCGFACRQNPKRGFLFVSKVLGKHYPVRPSKMKETYDVLSDKIGAYINSEDSVLFLGFAETATGLSSGIYDSWKSSANQDSMYLHTTRYEFSGHNVLFRFQEEHSHATGHIVYEPKGDFSLNKYKTLVLIDDEMTTGKTAMNFIEQFVQLDNCSINKIIVVCLKNWMSEQVKESFKEKLSKFDVKFVSLLEGNYVFNKDPSYVCEAMPNVEATNLYKNHVVEGNFGRFGVEEMVEIDFSNVLSKVNGKNILVLGTGEFSYQPYKLAQYLEQNGVNVFYQSTTRSPILVGNIIDWKLEFLDNYGDNISNFVYNVKPEQYDQVFICYETNDTFGCELDKKLNAEKIFFKDLV